MPLPSSNNLEAPVQRRRRHRPICVGCTPNWLANSDNDLSPLIAAKATLALNPVPFSANVRAITSTFRIGYTPTFLYNYRGPVFGVHLKESTGAL